MVQIRDHSIIEATCPFCKEPTNLHEESDQASDYFSHLEILLKDLLSQHFYEMFGRKLVKTVDLLYVQLMSKIAESSHIPPPF